MTGVRALINALRIREILLMTGFSFVGVLFVPAITISVIPKVGLFVFFYVFAIYALNSVVGHNEDQNSNRLKNVSLISKSSYVALFIITTILFVLLSRSVNSSVMWVCITALIMWATYYAPPLLLKSSFFGGTIVHFICGILHFHMGYASFETPTYESVLVSGIFALLLGIGHVNHEIIDSEADQKAGLKTTAVRVGLKWSSHIRTILSSGLVFYMLLLWYINVLSLRDTAIFLPPALLILGTSFFQPIRPFLFQKIARFSIATSCLILLMIRLANWLLIYG